MAFSSVLGASSVIKPGVVTTATRPSSPFVGQLIYDTTLSQTLAYNGSAWIVQTGGLVLIKTQTIGTTVSSVTVSDAFSSTYDNYKIVVGGGVASGGLSLGMTLGATATNYYWGAVLNGFNSSIPSGTSGSGIASNWRVADAGTDYVGFSADVLSPNLAARTMYSAANAYTTTTGYVLLMGGYLNNTTQYTAFTLTPNAGTLTGGTIKVYGYANSQDMT